MRTGYIKTTNVSQADATNFSTVTGIQITATEPTGTAARYVLKPAGGEWMHYNSTLSAFEAVATQELTAASVLEEGNTKAELEAISDAEKLAVFAGKKADVFVAISANDEAMAMPSLTSLQFTGRTGATTLAANYTSDAIRLTATGRPVEIMSITVDKSATANASATLQAAIQNESNEWTDWAEYTSFVTSPATKAVAIKFKGVLTVDSVGTAEAALGSVTIKHRVEDSAVFAEGTGTCISKTYNFTNPMTAAHLMVKHPVVADTEVKAYISMRGKPVEVKSELLGTGTGASQTVTLQHTDKIASHGFTLYFDGEAQAQTSYALSTTDGQVTFNADEGVVVTADYTYNWEKEEFVEMTYDARYPDTLDANMVDDQFNYQATKDTDPQGSVAAVRIDLVQNKGQVQDEAIGTGKGILQAFNLAHKAKSETLVVKVDGQEVHNYTYKDNTNVLFVTAPSGAAITASYSWAADTVYLESIACIFNR